MPRISDSLYLATGVLDHVAGGTLFYPGSGADWAVPVALFAPLVSDFWFVDRGYFIPGHEDTREDRLDRPPAEAPPLLLQHPAYVLRHRSIEQPRLQPGYCSGGPHFRHDWPDLDAWRRPEASDAVRDRAAPLILTEHYQHQSSGRNIRLHRCRGDARAYFEGEPRLTHLSVFFYRGDSAGEGGSGIRWLSPKLEAAVLQRLTPGGLFVSDGSDGAMCPDECPSIFRRGLRTRINPARDIARVVAAIKPIQTERGMRLRCVGYAGERYGSTLVWQTPTAENHAELRRDTTRAGPRAPHPYGSAFDGYRPGHPARTVRYSADIAGSRSDGEE
jgi:hypothetical protein